MRSGERGGVSKTDYDFVRSGRQIEFRAALPIEFEHQLHDGLTGGEIEAAGGFIGKQHRGPDHEASPGRGGIWGSPGELSAHPQHQMFVVRNTI